MWTLGADPEVFLKDSNGNLLPACGLIGGTKKKPRKLGDGYALQEDNIMMEYNVPPSDDPVSFAETVQRGLYLGLREVEKRAKSPVSALEEAEVKVPIEVLSAHDGAMEFGCSTDNNSYEDGIAYLSIHPDQLLVDDGAAGLRFAGGHVHMGYTRHTEIPGFVVAQLADVFVGLSSVSWDKQPNRRMLYGQPGRYRDTPYGIEYRTLSNRWVLDESYRDIVAHGAAALLGWLEIAPMKTIRSTYADIPWEDVRRAIVTEDEGLSADLCRFLSEEYSLYIVGRGM